MFDISLDQYLFPARAASGSTLRRQIGARLDRLDERELTVVAATVSGLEQAREMQHQQKTEE